MPEFCGDNRQYFFEVAVLHDLDEAADLATDGVEEEEEVLFALVDVIFLSLANKLDDKME